MRPSSFLSVRARVAHSATWLLALTACASTPAPRPEVAQATAAGPTAAAPIGAATAPTAPATATAPAPTCPRALALDQAAITDEATCLLAEYVRIDTTNPPGNELRAARFLQSVLSRDGIESQIIESAPGRANLIARLRSANSGGRTVVLMHHMDVVPAHAAEWSVPPFAAEVRDGELWGRGSIDNKGGGVVHLMTLLLAKRLQTPLPRDLVLLAVADEESGGAYGARALTAQHMELFQNVDFVLNEGGAAIDLGAGRLQYTVELAQKAPLWLRVTARGPSGHGAAPRPDSAVLKLVRALSRLAAHRFPIVVVPEVQALYAAKADAAPEPLRAGYRDLRAALRRPAFRAKFLEDPRDAALVQNTLSITMLQGSDKENVIPAEASAVLDMRLLPGQQPEAVTREVVAAMAEPGIDVTPLLTWQAHASPEHQQLFRAVQALAERRSPGAKVTTNVIGGFTDCNAFRAAGIACYGFLPMRIRPQTFALLHGKDERISLQDLSNAVLDLHALLLDLDPQQAAATPAR